MMDKKFFKLEIKDINGNLKFKGIITSFNEMKQLISIDTTVEYDLENLKKCAKYYLDIETSRYIDLQLNRIQEDLSDIATEEPDIKSRIIRILKSKKINLSTDDIIYKITQYILGEIADEQVQKELDSYKQLTPEDKVKILNLLKRAVEIAKIIEWKEKIWDIEEQLESQIDQIDSIEKLLKLDLKKLIEENYPAIDQIMNS